VGAGAGGGTWLGRAAGGGVAGGGVAGGGVAGDVDGVDDVEAADLGPLDCREFCTHWVNSASTWAMRARSAWSW